VADQNAGWEKLNLEPAPEEDAMPRPQRGPKSITVDPKTVAGYAQAKALIADCCQPWHVEWQAVGNNGRCYVRKAVANFFQAYLLEEDDVVWIELNGSAQQFFWNAEKRIEEPGEPRQFKMALGELDNIQREKGRVAERQPATGYVKMWPGRTRKGAMPVFVPAEMVPEKERLGWLRERPLEVLA
jgi:hypothetical protein